MRPSNWYLMIEDEFGGHHALASKALMSAFVVLSPGQATYEVHQARANEFHSPCIEFHGRLENCQQYIEWRYSRRQHDILAKLARVKIQVKRPQSIRFPVCFKQEAVREMEQQQQRPIFC